MTTFVESGMTFTFPDNDCFVIEKDKVVISGNCVKSCECVVRINPRGRDRYAFIEAKSSAPREKICDRNKLLYDGDPIDESWSIWTNFDRFIDDICLKFEDSYMVYRAMMDGCHGREARARIPSGCRDATNGNVMFVLIVNGFQEDWCQPLNDAIKKRLRHFLSSWNIPDIAVKTLNRNGAADVGIPVKSESEMPLEM